MGASAEGAEASLLLLLMCLERVLMLFSHRSATAALVLEVSYERHECACNTTSAVLKVAASIHSYSKIVTSYEC